jgi:hypothetical protein
MHCSTVFTLSLTTVAAAHQSVFTPETLSCPVNTRQLRSALLSYTTQTAFTSSGTQHQLQRTLSESRTITQVKEETKMKEVYKFHLFPAQNADTCYDRILWIPRSKTTVKCLIAFYNILAVYVWRHVLYVWIFNHGLLFIPFIILHNPWFNRPNNIRGTVQQITKLFSRLTLQKRCLNSPWNIWSDTKERVSRTGEKRRLNASKLGLYQ